MCTDGMGMVDLAVDRLIPAPSQWPEFYEWAHAAFDLSDDSWVPAGGMLRIFGVTIADERWNGSKPYAKMIHAIYLLAYALRDEYIPQWHARADYLNAAGVADNVYHGPFYLRFNDGTGEATSATGRFAARDRTDYHCRVFDLGSNADDPANRASVLVHEGWHHWQYKYGWVGTHLTGGRIEAGLEGDYYYRHGSGDFDFGTLWAYDLNSTPMKFHSPYQMSVEFDADLAEFSFGWLPLAVSQSARAYGNRRLESQFFNATSYRIGQPRPF